MFTENYKLFTLKHKIVFFSDMNEQDDMEEMKNKVERNTKESREMQPLKKLEKRKLENSCNNSSKKVKL